MEIQAKHFEELVTEGFGGVRHGSTADLGDYILSVSMSEFPANTDPMLAIETARIIAQRDLAGILGTKCLQRQKYRLQVLQFLSTEKLKLKLKSFLRFR